MGLKRLISILFSLFSAVVGPFRDIFAEPPCTLPNMSNYPIFVFTAPSMVLRNEIKDIVHQVEQYLPNLKRLCPVLDTTSENASEQTFYEYICHSPEEFELLEASGKFACTGENLSDQNKVALAKQLIDQNCLEGFGSLCELPVTAALSLRLSESYKPQVFLFLPNETEYFSKLEARFGEGSGDNQDKKILEKMKEEYFSILSIHENNPGMFKLVLSLQCV